MVIPLAIEAPEWGLEQPDPWVSFSSPKQVVRISCSVWEMTWKMVGKHLFCTDTSPSWSIPCSRPDICPKALCFLHPLPLSVFLRCPPRVWLACSYPRLTEGPLLGSRNEQCTFSVFAVLVLNHDALCVFHRWAWPRLNVLHPVTVCWINILNKNHEIGKGREENHAQIYFSRLHNIDAQYITTEWVSKGRDAKAVLNTASVSRCNGPNTRKEKE